MYRNGLIDDDELPKQGQSQNERKVARRGTFLGRCLRDRDVVKSDRRLGAATRIGQPTTVGPRRSQCNSVHRRSPSLLDVMLGMKKS